MTNKNPDKTKIAPRVKSSAEATTVAPRPQSAVQISVVIPESLGKRFAILEQLPTRGAEADIFKISPHDDPTETYILKLYRRDIRPKPEVIEKISGLNSKYVIRILEHGFATPDQYFELQEFAAEGSLHGRLWCNSSVVNDKSFAVPVVLNDTQIHAIFILLFRAIKHLSEFDISHHDIKPDNILLRSLNPLDLVLTDFGLARDEIGLTGMLQGTPQYMAPETSIGVRGTPFKTDAWSMGVIIYELLRQRHPFLGDDSLVILNQLRVAPKPIQVTEVSEEWKSLLEGLLQRRIEWRWGIPEVLAWLEAHAIEQGSLRRVKAYNPPVRESSEFGTYSFIRDDGTAVDINSLEMMGFHLAESPTNSIRDLERGKLSTFFMAQGEQQSNEGLRELGRKLTALEGKKFSDHAQSDAIQRQLELVALIHPTLPPYLLGRLVSLEQLPSLVQAAANGEQLAVTGVLQILFGKYFGRYAELCNSNAQTEVYDHVQKQLDCQFAAYELAIPGAEAGSEATNLTRDYRRLKSVIRDDNHVSMLGDAWTDALEILRFVSQEASRGDYHVRGKFEREEVRKMLEGQSYGLALQCQWFAKMCATHPQDVSGPYMASQYAPMLLMNRFVVKARDMAMAKEKMMFDDMISPMAITLEGGFSSWSAVQEARSAVEEAIWAGFLDLVESTDDAKRAVIVAEALIVKDEYYDLEVTIFDRSTARDFSPEVQSLVKSQNLHLTERLIGIDRFVKDTNKQNLLYCYMLCKREEEIEYEVEKQVKIFDEQLLAVDKELREKARLEIKAKVEKALFYVEHYVLIALFIAISLLWEANFFALLVPTFVVQATMLFKNPPLEIKFAAWLFYVPFVAIGIFDHSKYTVAFVVFQFFSWLVLLAKRFLITKDEEYLRFYVKNIYVLNFAFIVLLTVLTGFLIRVYA